jgi:hypothetical protein
VELPELLKFPIKVGRILRLQTPVGRFAYKVRDVRQV